MNINCVCIMGEKEIAAGGKYVIITSRISRESKIPRASENIGHRIALTLSVLG